MIQYEPPFTLNDDPLNMHRTALNEKNETALVSEIIIIIDKEYVIIAPVPGKHQCKVKLWHMCRTAFLYLLPPKIHLNRMFLEILQ